jgi:hypothetical protein
MSFRRAASALGALSLGLVVLTACDKPTAMATVTVGGKTVQAEASDTCFNHGKKLSQSVFIACLQKTPTHHITVPVGDQVRIGVDPSIADKGWLVVAGTLLVTSEPLKDKTYWSVDSDQLFNVQDPTTGGAKTLKEVTLNVVESADTTGQESYRVIQVNLVRGQ